jgi:hypothetical protein
MLISLFILIKVLIILKMVLYLHIIKNNKMTHTNFNYYYGSQPITRANFLANVPENWESELNAYGEYSYGYYKAVEVC